MSLTIQPDRDEVSSGLRFVLMDSVFDALKVRRLRNECRSFLTNCQVSIGILSQVLWYFRSYRKSKREGTYRVFLLECIDGRAIGYGALQLDGNRLLITECVAASFRGLGHGKSILKHLIQIGSTENRDLVAEIWASNVASIALHKRMGFQFDSETQVHAQSMQSFVLAPNLILR